jgi:tRNA 2-thiouridine synthesizing protein B
VSVLHIINKSPFETGTLTSCLRFIRPDDGLLLIEDGVYAAEHGTAAEASLRPILGKLRVHALGPDLQARGLSHGKLLGGIEVVDYGGFVDLTTEYDTLQSWS